MWGSGNSLNNSCEVQVHYLTFKLNEVEVKGILQGVLCTCIYWWILWVILPPPLIKAQWQKQRKKRRKEHVMKCVGEEEKQPRAKQTTHTRNISRNNTSTWVCVCVSVCVCVFPHHHQRHAQSLLCAALSELMKRYELCGFKSTDRVKQMFHFQSWKKKETSELCFHSSFRES